MKSPLQALLDLGVIPKVSFPTDSRYHGAQTLNLTTPNGETIAYLARRLVPKPDAANVAILARHVVKQGDRLDLIAAKYLGDPLLFWLVCDANGALAPDELVATPGSVLNISVAQGAPGVGNA
jgi:hypothetical protein